MKYLIQSAPAIVQFREKCWPIYLLATLALCIATVQVASGQSTAVARSGLINPQAVVFNPATGKVYSVDTEDNAVDIADDTAHSTVRAKVGAGPVSIAIDASNGNAYVANAGDGTVSVVDGKTDAVIATILVGSHPYSIAADSRAGRIYVSRTYSDQLAIIDATTNAVSSVKTGSADLIAIDQRTSTVYLLGYEGGDLTVLADASATFQKMSVGMHAWGMALNETSGAFYVARPGDAQVAVLQAGSKTPRMIPVGRIPCSVAVNPHTNRIYAVNYADNSLTVIDGFRVMATVPVGRRPQAVAVDAVRDLIFVANTQDNSVTVIDGGRNKVLDTLNAGNAPYALAINPISGKLHVANEDKTPFTVLDVNRFRNLLQ